jgi:uncharacterized protein YjiS (DUF1127 family)
MQWLRCVLWHPAFAAAVGVGDGETEIAWGPPSRRRRRGRVFRQRLSCDTGRALPRRRDRSRLSALSHHVLRDIGLTPMAAQFKGLTVDWRP